MIRTYSELITLDSFKKRYEYLKLDGTIGQETFGFERYLNQRFYKSREWKKIRDMIIVRDNGCDLGMEGYDIFGKILIHHINPIVPSDIEKRSKYLLNPEYLICTTHHTHNAIHYGNDKLLMNELVVRSRNDTCPWKNNKGDY